jgi:hypothetical protein
MNKDCMDYQNTYRRTILKCKLQVCAERYELDCTGSRAGFGQTLRFHNTRECNETHYVRREMNATDRYSTVFKIIQWERQPVGEDIFILFALRKIRKVFF